MRRASPALEGQTLACFFDPPTTGATLSGAAAAADTGAAHSLMEAGA